MMGRRSSPALFALTAAALCGALTLHSCGRSAPAHSTAPSPVASVTVSPDSVTLIAGGAMNLTATLRDAVGNAVANREPEWSSSKSSVAQVTGNGLVQAINNGRTVISASADGQQGDAVVQVVLPAPGAPITNCRMFPADNIWNRDISRLPLHAKSATWVSAIGGGKQFYVGFSPGSYGMQYALTGAGTPKVSIAFSQDPAHCDPGPYPFTATTPLEVGTPDAHAFMIDTTTCTLYELYGANWNNGHPKAAAGMVFDLTSDALHEDGWSTADEAGLTIFSGLARWDEVLAGSIAHALRFEAASGHIDGTLGAHLWPARHDPHYTSTNSSALPPMGARFRLKSSFDISAFSPHAQVVLLALQHYGMFLSDIGYDWELIGTADPRWEKSVIDELETVPASAFEVVDESSLMIDPGSGQSLTPP